MPGSRQKSELARILAEQGYIDAFSIAPATDAPGDILQINLKYDESRRSAISGLRRVSRPGRRSYVDAKHIPRVQGGMGTTIVSTSKGVMTGHEARAAGVGGELIAEVW
jgi:small subunit ribosomal protein S8